MQSLSLAANTGRTRVVQYANIYRMCSLDANTGHFRILWMSYMTAYLFKIHGGMNLRSRRNSFVTREYTGWIM